MPSVTTRKTRQRSKTPTRQKIAKSSEGLTPGWTSAHPDLFKEPVFISPLKTRPSTRRQSMFIRATTDQKTGASSKRAVSSKKPNPTSAMTGLRQPSAPRESVSNKKRTALKSPPPSESTAATKKVTRSRSRTPSRVKDERSRSPRKESGSASKIPVKSRERTPSRGRRATPSRETRSRSRSRTRAGTPLKRSSSAGRETPSSNKRAIRKPTPSRETPSRSVSQKKQAVKRPASPARTATPLKAAKVLGKSQVASPAETSAVATPQTSTPSRLGSRKRTADIPVSEIRYSKRLAAKGVPNTSMDVTLDSTSANEEAVVNGNGWGSWCTIL